MKIELEKLIKTVLRLMAKDCEPDAAAKQRMYSRIFSEGRAGAENEQN